MSEISKESRKEKRKKGRAFLSIRTLVGTCVSRIQPFCIYKEIVMIFLQSTCRDERKKERTDRTFPFSRKKKEKDFIHSYVRNCIMFLK